MEKFGRLGVLTIKQWLIVALSLGLSGQLWALDSTCFPKVDTSQPQYLVASGTLMLEASREKKLNKAEVELPVWVSGYERGWFVRVVEKAPKRTVLGVSKDEGKLFNGLLLASSDRQISSLDRNEHRTCRTLIDVKQLNSMAGGQLPEKGQIWIYVVKPKNKAKPAGKYPIQQSDVDNFLTGCLEQSKTFSLPQFAEQCVDTTVGWSENWTNDRERPSGGELVQNKRVQINKLLERLEGGLFEKVRDE
ncbi:gamma-glutamylcyclotransferase family protein [Endozoicomonas numazuensis]|uniref:Uncharacterized protein n=1 Tax=Endozoicomonas numazuensis TaxID=1137799 RepID=A0A081N008_9GAMM|nr:gamma-glutamylcyclotransferase family protein [Endozoicomonas numazuensis]KEQ11781.1 hypothetical protein GZ78_28435 [Endozoicomonas numazuensis]